MKCPKCNKDIDLYSIEQDGQECSHCTFYHYIRTILTAAFGACQKIDLYSRMYFRAIHQKIYTPFIKYNESKISPTDGAYKMVSLLITMLKNAVGMRHKDDLLFTALALRELATIKILLYKDDIWKSAHQRSVSHAFTNLINSLDDKCFGDYMIADIDYLVNIYVLVEEISKIISNIQGSRHFGWKHGLGKMIKDRLENEELESFLRLYETEDSNKPEEITFDDNYISQYLKAREMTIEKIKEDKIGKIIELMHYKPVASRNIYEKLLDEHMDYKFIFRFENIIAFGETDSDNSIYMFKNIVTSDHFIEDIFGVNATALFKKSQQKIAALIGLKIAHHFSKKEGFFVPMQQKGVPYTNISIFKGNGIRLKPFNEANQTLGDFDAIVIDENNKRALLFEVKYYKPSTNIYKLLHHDKGIFDDLEKITARSNWFKTHINEIIKAWELKHDSYTVETILVTARPNYYGIELQKSIPEIKYHTLDQVLEDKI